MFCFQPVVTKNQKIIQSTRPIFRIFNDHRSKFKFRKSIIFIVHILGLHFSINLFLYVSMLLNGNMGIVGMNSLGSIEGGRIICHGSTGHNRYDDFWCYAKA